MRTWCELLLGTLGLLAMWAALAGLTDALAMAARLL